MMDAADTFSKILNYYWLGNFSRGAWVEGRWRGEMQKRKERKEAGRRGKNETRNIDVLDNRTKDLFK